MSLFGIKEKQEMESWRENFRREEFKNRKTMENVIETRIMLYTIFPDKITEISTIFQRFGFG